MYYKNGVPYINGVAIGNDTPAPGRFGETSNYFDISSGGIATLAGTAKRSLTLRPFLEFSILKQTTKPTGVAIGIFNAYSMPIYNSDNEELFFRMRVPYRWDGVTNPCFKMIVALSDAEDVGDKFQFQYGWNHVSVAGVIPVDSNDVPTETTIITDHAAQYSTYSISFEMDLDVSDPHMASRDNLVGRIRRIAASGSEVANEILVLDWVTVWTIDKLYGSF
jgi:hypothetical protein